MVALLLFFFLAFTPSQDLYLQAYLDTEDTWYPGQENTIVYKIWYKGEIALVKEDLPLLNIKGLEKVGDKIFYESEQPPFSIQAIHQKYRAKNPGDYISPPSSLEGVHYVMEGGVKKILPPKLTSSIPSYTITIAPFPTQDQPPDFNGSIGTGTFKLIPPQENEARVGDPIIFKIIANDFEPTSVLIPPNLNCLPGFTGFFKNDANTTITKIKTNVPSTTFQFGIIAENSLPQEIPPIVWSVFNPVSKSYRSFTLGPIPLTLIDSPPLNPFTKVAIPSITHLESLDPLPLPLMPEGAFWLDRSWLPLHLSLLGLMLCLLLLRKPLRKLWLLHQFNPLRRAEKIIKKQQDPLESAKIMRSLLTVTLQQKNLSQKDERAKPIYDFIELLDRFRFAQGVRLSKETILKTGKKLYRALPLFLILIPSPIFADMESPLEKGNRAKTWSQREKEWNLALKERLLAPSTEKTDLEIGFLLQQFQENPYALYYLERAAKNAPFDQALQKKICTLKEQMGVTDQPQSIFRHFNTALKIAPVFLFLIGFYLFFIRKWQKAAFSFASGTFLIALFYLLPFFTSKTALLLSPTFIYQDSTLKQKATPLPLIPGDSVEIVGMDGETFKIYSYPLETYGYILQTTLRPIN